MVRTTSLSVEERLKDIVERLKAVSFEERLKGVAKKLESLKLESLQKTEGVKVFKVTKPFVAPLDKDKSEYVFFSTIGTINSVELNNDQNFINTLLRDGVIKEMKEK